MKMLIQRRRVLFGALSLCLVVAIGCNKSAPPQPTTVKIGYSKLRITLPVFVAQARGFFKKHGIEAELLPYDTAQPLMQALINGNIQLAGYTALPITYAAMLRGNTRLYFITLMEEDQNHRISYLLKRTGSDIKSIADLKGKSVGILPTTAYNGWLKAILDANGVAPNSVTIKGIAPEQEVATLKNGGVDALFTNDPMATAAIREHVGEFITEVVECPKYIRDPFPFGSFNVSKAWGDANPEAFRGIVAALDEAVAYINANPKEAQNSMRQYIAPQFGQDIESYPFAKYVDTSHVSPDVFQEMVDLYVKQNVIDASLPIRDLVVTPKR